MAAAPFAATFKGFVATSVDAAILVSAAMANLLPRVDGHPDSAGYRQLSGSGTVVVFGPRVQRWREGLNWSPRRAIGDGFDVYRQTSKDAAQQLTEAECVSPFFFFAIFSLFCLSRRRDTLLTFLFFSHSGTGEGAASGPHSLPRAQRGPEGEQAWRPGQKDHRLHD